MYFVPCNLTIEGRGSLLPEERRTIYAPIAGTIIEVPVEHGDIVKKGDVIARARQQGPPERVEEADRERDKAWSQKLIAENQDQKASNSQSDQDMQYQVKSQLAEARLTYKSANEQIEIVQEQLEMMTIKAATGWDHHDLGGEEEPAGAAGGDRP